MRSHIMTRVTFRGKRANTTRITLASIALVGIVALGGCASGSPDPGDDIQKPTPVTVGTYYSLADLVSLNAIDYAADLGIDLQLTTFNTGGTGILTSVNAGTSDFGDIAMTYVMRGVVTGLPITTLMGTGSGGIGLIADPSIESVSDLKGKTVGVTQASTNYLSLLSALDQAGMTPDDVNIVNIEAAALGAAFASGQVDAIQTVIETAYTSMTARNGHVIYSPTDEDLVGTYNSAIITTSTYAKTNPELVDKVVKAFQQSLAALEDLKKNDPDKLVDLAAKLLNPGGISREAVEFGLDYVSWAAPLNLDTLAEYSRQLKNYGIIESDIADELADHVDMGPYAKAAGGTAADYTG